MIKKKILLSLKEHKYVILRGLFRKTDVDKTLNNLKKKFKHKNDKIRPPGKYDLIKKNYQRFMFGITGGLNKTTPRYFRVFYNPLWSKDIYNGRNIFLKLNKLQNYFYDLEENYGEEKKKNQQGMARMLHQEINNTQVGADFWLRISMTEQLELQKN